LGYTFRHLGTFAAVSPLHSLCGHTHLFTIAVALLFIFFSDFASKTSKSSFDSYDKFGNASAAGAFAPPEVKQRTFSEFQLESNRAFMLPNGASLRRGRSKRKC
jgi:hypothetical protein